MPNSFSAQAQAQALGYLYQIRYALLLFLKNGIEDPEAQISIEYLDDIAFEKNGDPTELIQAKHHIKSASLSDSSTDLWRTLRVWCENLLQNKLQLDNVTLTLITTEHVSDDTAVSMLKPFISGKRNSSKALENLELIARTSDNKTNYQAYNAFLNLDESQRQNLLDKIQILDNSPNIIEAHSEIAHCLRYTTRPKFLSAVQERLEGWWFSIVIKHLFLKDPEVIHHRDLQFKLNDIQEQFHDDNLPNDTPYYKIKKEDAETDNRVFVQQLRLIEANIIRIQKAIGDFYRASEQRSRWVRECILPIDELEGYHERLCDEWERLFAIMQENLETNCTEKSMVEKNMIIEGKALLTKIESLTLHIRPRFTDPYIMRGSFHILANSLHVGWHIDFHRRLTSFTA